MRRVRLMVGLIGLVALSLVVSGCLNLFAPKVGEVRGKVTYASGTPIADAEVKLGTAVAKTNAQGEFAFLNIKHGTYDLSVVVGGKTVHTEKVTVSNKPANVNVTVPDPVQYGKVLGTVKRENGDPVSDVMVRMGELTTTTDEDGKFEFSNVPYGIYTVVAEVDGEEFSAAAHLNAPEITVNIIVDEIIRFAEVKGVVKDPAGRPVDNATFWLGDDLSYTAGADGEFVLTHVPYGTYHVTVTVWQGLEIYKATLTVDDEVVELEIVVDVARIEGYIVDQADNPVSGADIQLGTHWRVTSDVDGSYSFKNIPYGTYLFTVDVDGNALYSQDLVIDQFDVSYDVQVTLPGAGPVLVYEQDFSGPGSTPADYGFSIGNGGTWTIEEDEGKRWIRGEHESWAMAYVSVPEVVGAERIIVEYVVKPIRSNAGFNMLADRTTANGGTNYFSYHITWTHAFRVMLNERQQVNHQSLEGKADAGVTKHMRITIDRTAATVDVEVDGLQASGYPLNLLPEHVIDGPNNTLFRFYVNDAAAQWTNLKIWVE